MGAHNVPNLAAFEAAKAARNEATARRSELIEMLRGHIGKAVCVKGYPSAVMLNSGVGAKTGNFQRISGPVYSVVDSPEDRKPYELDDVALLGVTEDRFGDLLVVSVVSPDEVEARSKEPDTRQGYKFYLGQIVELSFSETSVPSH